MDGSCGSVSLDRYWNSVAIPFLFIILGFGLFVLFGLSDIQFTSTDHIIRSIGAIAGTIQESKRNTGRRDEPPPPPPPPAKNANKGTAPPPAKNANKGAAPPPTTPATNANIMANLAKGVGK